MARLKSGVGAALLVIVPTSALAHPGAELAHSFASGFLHPLSGADHLLAMIAVGVIAAKLGGRALWRLPLTFLSFMAAGGLLGAAGTPVPFVEPSIALSVVVLGTIVAAGLRWPARTLFAIVAGFAIMHGQAHGIAIAGASPLGYGAGFLAATACLHGLGMALGMAAARRTSGLTAIRMYQTGGITMAAIGMVLLAGAV